jgi:aminoglycoside/choline kinase family phosphotransferase
MSIRKGALPPPPVQVIEEALSTSPITIDWLAGDGSDRCYYRLNLKATGQSHVLMQLSGADAKALQQDGYDWIKLAHILKERQICVPGVIKALPDFAALIIEDYGDQTLEAEIFKLHNENNFKKIEVLYKKSSDMISNFLKIPADPNVVWCKRSFDAERYIWELNFFIEHYATPVAGIKLDENQKSQLDKDIHAISNFLGSYSKYFVHRDYHSRNLMVFKDALAVIDFQDARLGAPAYDYVSLFFDSYVPLTQSVRIEFMNHAVKTSPPSLQLDAHWKPCLLQRQLKAIGSFGFLTLIKNRGNYLKHVPDALASLPHELVYDKRWGFLSGEFLELLKQRITP